MSVSIFVEHESLAQAARLKQDIQKSLRRWDDVLFVEDEGHYLISVIAIVEDQRVALGVNYMEHFYANELLRLSVNADGTNDANKQKYYEDRPMHLTHTLYTSDANDTREAVKAIADEWNRVAGQPFRAATIPRIRNPVIK